MGEKIKLPKKEEDGIAQDEGGKEVSEESKLPKKKSQR